MFQRQRIEPRRQQLSGTSVNSSYFTSTESRPSSSVGSYAHHQPSSYDSSMYYQQTSSPSQSPTHHTQQQYYSTPVNHTSSDSIGNGRKHRGGSGGGGISFFFFVVWTAIIVIAMYGYYEYVVGVSSPKQSAEAQAAEEELHRTRQHWKDKYHELLATYDELAESHAELKSQTEKLSSELSSQTDNVRDHRRELNEVQSHLQLERKWALEWKEKAIGLENSLHSLERQIQDFSKQQVIHKYGHGPHNVELEVLFDSNDRGYMTLELAPLDEMPHTLYTFLEQVNLGLFNGMGFAFHHNGPHIIMGSPTDQAHIDRFWESGVGHVLFPEYSNAFPHVAYTAGLSGRPGGPDFYFNTRDNTHSHGPQGYSTDGLADPCFGRITRGWDIVDRIHASTGELMDGDWKEIQPAILIQSIKLL